MMFKMNFDTFEISKISAKLYDLLYRMFPDHILKLVGWPQARQTTSVTPKEHKPPNKGHAKSTLVYTLNL